MGKISPARAAEPSRILIAAGVVFAGIGLLCHLVSARAIGGSFIAYRDHIAGFVIISLVTGAILAALGWRLWRSRPDITILSFGVVQLLFGIFVYSMRYHMRG